MSSMMDIVPLEITETIAKNLDIKTFPAFLASCKYASQHTKNIFENMVQTQLQNVLTGICDAVKELHNRVSDQHERNMLTSKILKGFMNKTMDVADMTMFNGEHANGDFGGIQFLFDFREIMLEQICQKTDSTPYDVETVVWKIIGMEPLEEDWEGEVLLAFQEYFFGEKSYNVCGFCKSPDVYLYGFSFNFAFTEEGDITAKVSIAGLDDEDERADSDDTINDNFPDAEMTCDGEIMFTVTEENIKCFAAYVSKTFGNAIFTCLHTVQIEICNPMNNPYTPCKFYKDIIMEQEYTKIAVTKIKSLFNTV